MNIIDLMREADKGSLIFKDPEEIRSLRIWYCKYKSINEIKKCVNLTELVIAGVPDENLDFLNSLRKLKFLRILHMPKITDIEPISNLTNLEYLSLATNPSWDSSGKKTIVNSLKPIADLPKLKGVELFGVCPADKSLRDLEGHKALHSARVSGYLKSEVKRFYGATSFDDNYIPESSFG